MMMGVIPSATPVWIGDCGTSILVIVIVVGIFPNSRIGGTQWNVAIAVKRRRATARLERRR
jgi:hypothetical protein